MWIIYVIEYIYRRMWLADYPKNQLSVVHRGFCINMDEGRYPVAIDCNGKLYEVIVKESICGYHELKQDCLQLILLHRSIEYKRKSG